MRVKLLPGMKKIGRWTANSMGSDVIIRSPHVDDNGAWFQVRDFDRSGHIEPITLEDGRTISTQDDPNRLVISGIYLSGEEAGYSGYIVTNKSKLFTCYTITSD